MKREILLKNEYSIKLRSDIKPLYNSSSNTKKDKTIKRLDLIVLSFSLLILFLILIVIPNVFSHILSVIVLFFIILTCISTYLE